MSTQPLISVIVPVYKTENTLRRCLDSICGQSYTNLEIICINDGSPDNSHIILEEFAQKDKRIKIITQENRGLADARNRGLEIATGVWVTGVDSDDYIESDTYDYCSTMLGREDVSIVCYGTEIIGGAKHSNKYYFLYPAEGVTQVSPEILSKTNVCFVNKLYRKSFIDMYHARFPVGIWFEDEAFFNTLAPYAKYIAYLGNLKYKYVQLPDGKSIMNMAASGHAKVMNQLDVMDWILTHYTSFPLSASLEGYKKHILSHYYKSLVRLTDNNPSIQSDVLQKYREIVDKHHLLELSEEDPELSLLYYAPIRCSKKHFDLAKHIEEQKHREKVLVNHSLVQISYQFLKVKRFFSWGAKRKYFNAQLIKLKGEIKEYRSIRSSLINLD